MFDCSCVVCGDRFSAKTMFATVCGSRCAMRRYRSTEKGRTRVKEYNKRYKRPDIEKVCSVCGLEFVTARESQEFCGNCSGGKEANYLSQKRHRAKHPNKARIRDRTSKRINRDKTLERLSCCLCGDEKSEAHHYNYDHPLNVIFLCKKHHTLVHSFSFVD